MFLYVNMLSISSDMSDMFVRIRICFRSCIGLIMLLIVFSIRLLCISYVCFDLVSVPVCIRFVSISISLNLSQFGFRFRVTRLDCV
ncbi:hypothetical protein HanRHA438_Chr15g0707481 [Helianthus annuus]|nr:hypothetical protein HanIR_Chr15g0755571 [Helianthus annuus]KAJ0844892.1 hypothetical protein HanRHA438_Chr15g0707481 [Helianthus annuus]